MRWSTRRVGAALLSGAVVSGAVWFALRPTVQPQQKVQKVQPVQLSADEFNALQSPALLSAAFRPAQPPWAASGTVRSGGKGSGSGGKGNGSGSGGFRIQLFRLLGCPYCAKVEWVLRFHRVPFDVVDVDPITGAGLPDARYSLAPQLRLAPLVSPAEKEGKEKEKEKEKQKESEEAAGSALVVDSQRIIAAVAVPLGFDAELRDPRVAGTCEWISERFQAVSFVATSGTMRDAFATYIIVTPQRYHNMAFRIVGTSALYALSRYKIQPNLAKRAGSTGTPMDKNTDAWLQEELAEFAARRGSHVFHGGNKPDLADVEMFAVTRVVDAHPRLSSFLHQGPIGQWHAAMCAEMQKRTV